MSDQEYKVPGRAYTVDEKRKICDRLFGVWCHANTLRLGQLIMNAIDANGPDLFYIEDEALCDKLEAFLDDHRWHRE